MKLHIIFRKELLYNLRVKAILDGGSIPPASTKYHFNEFRGATRFRLDNGNYKTARRRMMASLTIIQTITANDYDLALAA